ncbi:hypothetical protein DMUE_5946 [Dictyocoela muelleri]|nr:hypothetical protein DMUE_5946 [Dictyocoela muelleri]
MSPETIPYVSSYKTLVNLSSRIRRNLGIMNSNDDIPDIIKKTEKGDDFYMYDFGINDPDRVLVFSTFSNIQHLSYNNVWICDGTFRSSPRDYYQIYTIMAVINHKTFPLAYFIMKRKSMLAYKNGLIFLKSNQKNLLN